MTQIQPANLIPSAVLADKKAQATIKKIARWFIRLNLLLLFFTVSILSFCYYQTISRDMDVPDNIKQDYITAQNNMELVKKKNELYQKAISRDNQAIKTLTVLLTSKPADIRFTKLDIPNAKEVQLEGFASDPSLINQYVEAINNSGYFTKASAEKIASTTNEQYKTFTIHMEKIK